MMRCSIKERDSFGNPELMVTMASRNLDNAPHRNVVVTFLWAVANGDFSENGFVNPKDYYGGHPAVQFHNAIQLNGRSFSNVQSITFDTTVSKKSPVYKLYIARGHGVLAYETYNPALLWVKE